MNDDAVPYRARSTIYWQFDRGDLVHVPHDLQPYPVVQQRVTLRDVLGPVFDYLVQLAPGICLWYDEADLIAADETPSRPHGKGDLDA
jgi:hypothetical protein